MLYVWRLLALIWLFHLLGGSLHTKYVLTIMHVIYMLSRGRGRTQLAALLRGKVARVQAWEDLLHRLNLELNLDWLRRNDKVEDWQLVTVLGHG